MEAKRPFDKLFDYFVQSPKVFEEADCLGRVDVITSLRITLKIIDRCFEIDAGLENFLQELKASYSGSLYWSESSRESQEADDGDGSKDIFPVAFRFADLRTATTMMYYWSTLVMLWSGLCQLYNHLANLKTRGIDAKTLAAIDPDNVQNCKASQTNRKPVDAGRGRLAPLGHRIDFATPAWNICQSVEYCTQEEMLDFGAQAVAVPLRIVIDTMQSNPAHIRQILWAKDQLAKASERLRILRFPDD